MKASYMANRRSSIGLANCIYTTTSPMASERDFGTPGTRPVSSVVVVVVV